MKVTVITSEDRDGLRHQRLVINGENKLRVSPLSECPEDAIIGRDLVSCDDIIKYMKIAYEAAKRGENIEFEDVEMDWEKFSDY